MRMAAPCARRWRTPWPATSFAATPTSIRVSITARKANGLPFPATMQVLERGQERYNIYCTPCHSRVGNGDGMIVQRGYAQAGDFHD